ncbi:MAG: PDZ domain-containing protein [Deltaproteobacteria bacterium]|nr:PDZ domain-containing protein [Deltaproteobacteria bacterium]
MKRDGGHKEVLNAVHNKILSLAVVCLSAFSISVFSTGCQDKKIVRGYPDQYSGIGVELKIDEASQQPIVERVLSGSPAEQAGVKVGDKIVAIDEEATQGLPFGEIIFKIRGKPGSQLSLKLDRAGRTIWSVMPRGSLKRVNEDYKLSTDK